MFEKFTQQARLVIMLAENEADPPQRRRGLRA
jgi:hypothetical protein